MKRNFDAEEIRSAFYGNERQAEILLNDAAQAHEVLGNAEKLLIKIKNMPVIGGLIDDIGTIIEMIGACLTGTYQEAPLRVVVAAMVAIIYLLSPIDLIPDFIPVFGWMDDAAVITLALSMGVSAELEKYRIWKEDDETRRRKDEYVEKIMCEMQDELNKARGR